MAPGSQQLDKLEFFALEPPKDKELLKNWENFLLLSVWKSSEVVFEVHIASSMADKRISNQKLGTDKLLKSEKIV